MHSLWAVCAAVPFFCMLQCAALSAGCEALLGTLPNVTFESGSERYAYENFWSNTGMSHDLPGLALLEADMLRRNS